MLPIHFGSPVLSSQHGANGQQPNDNMTARHQNGSNTYPPVASSESRHPTSSPVPSHPTVRKLLGSRGIASLTIDTGSLSAQAANKSATATAVSSNMSTRASGHVKRGRWHTLEFKFYYLVFAVAVPVMVYVPVSLSRPSNPNFYSYSGHLKPGWIAGRLRDDSDFQYRSFRDYVPALIGIMGVYLLLSKLFTLLPSSGNAQYTRIGNSNSNSNSNTLINRMTRDRSSSHVSAVSSGSQSGASSRGIDLGPRSSPSLAPNYQALSIAEENGWAPPVGHTSATGSSSTFLTRAGRASSVAESVTSHASSSSLRSNFLSASEQAQAILNHEAPYVLDGPDGTSSSLAAQLAAYGEALALERKRAGDARGGPSPALSARGSNAARSKLPSVSEDQSPSRSASHSSRSFSVSEQRTPNLPATAAQSYNRRVSRRPHSSEGRQSQDSAKRGVFGAVAMLTSPSPLTTTDKARLELDGHSAQSPGDDKLASSQTLPKTQQLPSAGEYERDVLPQAFDPYASRSFSHTSVVRGPLETAIVPAVASGQPVSSGTYATDRGEQLGPAVPPKDQSRRRHKPVLLSSASGLALGSAAPGGDATMATTPTTAAAAVAVAVEMDDDDEDDPKTPVLGSAKTTLDKFANSPGSRHRHSPSLPTELSSYVASRLERLPNSALASASAAGSGTGTGSSSASPAPPRPPQKESINAPRSSAEGASTVGHGGMLLPDSGMWSRSRAGDGMLSPDDEANRDRATSGRWEGLRRPSLNMLRSATSSSMHSQTPSHTSLGGSTDDHGHSRGSTEDSMAVSRADQQPTSDSGKRRLVRNLLNKAKGSS